MGLDRLAGVRSWRTLKAKEKGLGLRAGRPLKGFKQEIA